MNKRKRQRVAAVLIIIPFLVYFSVPLYNITNPAIGGLPFFYWFQILMLPITAILLFKAAKLIDG
ncbi:MAG: DUF3311 domain-containing protein [Candidatus Marsarchaeota archaeon]|nr:DUF3311 domain-containing protein [Candidatus Marsarchaeota archaeon]